MADLDCQLDWIWNQLTNKATGHTWKGFSWSGYLKKEDLLRRDGPLSGSQSKGGTEGRGKDLVLVSLSSHLAGKVFTLLLLLLLRSLAGIRSQLHHDSKWTGDGSTPGCSVSPVSGTTEAPSLMGQAVTRLSPSPVRRHFGLPGPYWVYQSKHFPSGAYSSYWLCSSREL